MRRTPLTTIRHAVNEYVAAAVQVRVLDVMLGNESVPKIIINDAINLFF